MNSMNYKKTALSAAIFTVLGTSCVLNTVSAAVNVPDGDYDLVILTTPVKNTAYGATAFKIGKDGNYSSSFSFGALPGNTSQGMTDTATEPNVDTGTMTGGNIAPAKGIAGDSYAGILRIHVTGGTYTASSFSKDAIFSTAGGTFGQFVDPGPGTSAMSGTLDAATGAMTFTPTNRLGTIDAPKFINEPWNVDDTPSSGACNPTTSTGNTNWMTLTTGSASNSAGLINGTALTNIGDINGDNATDFNAVLVSSGHVGTAWGTFCGADFSEIWHLNLLAFAINDSAAVSVANTSEICVLDNDGVGGGTPPASTQPPPATPPPTITATGGALAKGSVTVNTASAACSGKDSITYTPNSGTTIGSDSFTYTITNPQGQTSSATVNMTLSANPALASDDGPFNANQGNTATPIPTGNPGLTANDLSSAGAINAATLAPVSPTAQGGTVVVNGTNVDYTPPSASFTGSDSFTYTVQDAIGNTTDPATVTVTVNAFGTSSAGSYTAGTIAAAAGASDGKITDTDLPADPDVNATCVGGCFDFIITGAANPTQIVPPPLGLPITADLTLRKFINGTWQDFDTATTNDTVASAPLSPNGGCPVASDPAWVLFNGAKSTAANAGHVCLRYTIADAGPNDADAATPGTIADPSGLSSPTVVFVKSGLEKSFRDNAGGGCTLSGEPAALVRHAEWPVIAAVIGLFGWLRRKIHRQQTR